MMAWHQSSQPFLTPVNFTIIEFQQCMPRSLWALTFHSEILNSVAKPLSPLVFPGSSVLYTLNTCTLISLKPPVPWLELHSFRDLSLTFFIVFPLNQVSLMHYHRLPFLYNHLSLPILQPNLSSHSTLPSSLMFFSSTVGFLVKIVKRGILTNVSYVLKGSFSSTWTIIVTEQTFHILNPFPNISVATPKFYFPQASWFIISIDSGINISQF